MYSLTTPSFLGVSAPCVCFVVVCVMVCRVVGAFCGGSAAVVIVFAFTETDASVGRATSTDTEALISAEAVVVGLSFFVVAGTGAGKPPPTCATRAFLAAWA